MPDPGEDVDVRAARSGEFVDAMRLFEGALLEVDAGAVRKAIESDPDDDAAVLVAVADETVVGALYATPSLPTSESDDAPPSVPPEATHIAAVAVRRERRGRGVGSALVAAALRRTSGETDSLTAAFDADVRSFYDALGFEVTEADAGPDEDGRLWGVLSGGRRIETERSGDLR